MENQNYTSSGNLERNTFRGLWTKISWSSIFAGFIVAVIIHFLLSLLGIGIGLATVQPMKQQNPLEGLGIGAIIWWVLSVLISVFIGGFVAGRWAGALKTSGRSFHGVLSWSLFTMFSFYILTTTLGGLIGGVGNLLGQALNMAGSGIAQTIPMLGDDEAKRDFEKIIGGAEGRTSQFSEIREVMDAFQQYINTGSEEDRKKLAEEISSRTEMSKDEIDAEILRLESEYVKYRAEAELRAREIGDDASRAMSKAAFITFFALIFGAGASAWGGGIAKRDIETEILKGDTNS
jgi:hypothetical protein